MLIQAFTFYLFAGILVLSAFMVITARNPVHSVLFLILAFFNSAGLFIMLGAEFVGMILVIVYVGAVAVLFLFVVMMFDINFHDLRKGAMQYVPIGLLAGGILLAELSLVYAAWNFVPGHELNLFAPIAADTGDLTNTEQLGRLLYTEYFPIFQLAGLVLFVAMIGAIVLTHRTRPGVKRQNIGAQHYRKREDVLELKKVNPGSGGE